MKTKTPTQVQREEAIALRWRFHLSMIFAQFMCMFTAVQHADLDWGWSDFTWQFNAPFAAAFVLLAIEEAVLRRDVKRLK
jgi:hypothetical protein